MSPSPWVARCAPLVADGGPVLDLASTLQFAALVDAVVLAVPLARQKADDLTDMARQLESVQAKLLPVVTSPSRRSAKGEVVGSDGVIAMPGLSGTSSTVNVAGRQPAGAHQRPGGPGGPTYADTVITQNPQPNPGAHSNPVPYSGADTGQGAHSAGPVPGYQAPPLPGGGGPEQPPLLSYNPPPQAGDHAQHGQYPSNGTPPVLPPGAGAVPPDHGSSG